MKFNLLSEVETLILKIIISSGEEPITAKEVEMKTDFSNRTIYNALISMAAVGILDQLKLKSTQRGRPTVGYTITDLGMEVFDTNKKVLRGAAQRSLEIAIAG